MNENAKQSDPEIVPKSDSMESVHSSHSSHADNTDQQVGISVSDNGETSLSLRNMSREQLFTIITFCFTNFCVGAFYSLLAPFFPQEVITLTIFIVYPKLVY